jgi:hypothetical protein
MPDLSIRSGMAASHTVRCHYPLERWPLNDAEMRGDFGSAPVSASPE